jgi:hypothetical protein
MKRNAVQQQAPFAKSEDSKSETVTGRRHSGSKTPLARQRAAVLLSPGAERLQWQWSNVQQNPFPANRLPESPPSNQ